MNELDKEFIDLQNKQIEFAKQMIEKANSKKVTELATQIIEKCEKAINIINKKYESKTI